jgi:chromate transporter
MHPEHSLTPEGSDSALSSELSLKQPKSKAEMFMVFTVLALQGVGGVLAVAQRELVERRKWMTNAQFVEEWSVAQVMPGPNIVNLSLMLGGKYFGVSGAIASAAGLITVPMFLVLGLAILFGGVSDSPAAQGALKGMGAVSSGLIIATGLKLATSLRQSPLGLWFSSAVAVASFLAVGVFRVPLAWALLGLGTLSVVFTFRALRKLHMESPLKP